MDSSTGSQCHQLEQRCGGAASLAQLTGSRAYEVMTCPLLYDPLTIPPLPEVHREPDSQDVPAEGMQ